MICLKLFHDNQTVKIDQNAHASAQTYHPLDVPEKTRRSFFIFLGILFMGLSFLFNSPGEIWEGSIKIIYSPCNLLTDYFELTSIGATLMNAGIMTLVSVGVVIMNRATITGPVAAAIFTVAGFSFFGKNLFNSIPIALGVLVYSKFVRLPYNRFLAQALFGSALGPLVSMITFSVGLPLPAGLLAGTACGMLAGFLLPPLSSHFLRFHQGFNLYNIGFTAGIIGTFFIAVLRGFGIDVETVSILSSGNNRSLSILLYGIFAVMIILGFIYNGKSFSGYRQMLSQSGKLASDFILIVGPGITLINMAMLGTLATTYVLLIGGQINGPIIGGIFTMVGFGAFGKHLRNVIPIFGGVFLANLLNIYELDSTTALVSTLFGTTLAPIAGYYGAGYGILAGVLHMAMVTNIGYLHGGINLYNNGFSGGFIAAAMVPALDMIKEVLDERKKERAKKAVLRKK